MLLFSWDEFWSTIGGFLVDTVLPFLLDVLTFLPKIIYFLISCLFSLVDLFQVVFRKIAGLDVIMISNEVTKGDSIYKVLTDALFTGRYPAISTTFWGLIILGLFMLIVTSIIAVIRLEYAPDKDKGNSKAGVIKNFFKALFSFAIVPVACLFGMYLGNSLVGIIDSAIATSETVDIGQYKQFDTWDLGEFSDNELMTNGETKNSYIAFNIFGINIPTSMEPFSATVFKASAAQCNRLTKYGAGYLNELNAINALGIFDGSITESSEAADLIDTAFMYNAKLKTEQTLNYDGISDDYCKDYLKDFFGETTISSFSRYNVTLVWYFYDLWTFNYIIGFVAITIIVKLYWQFCLSMMARFFEIAGLFLIAPIPVAIMPLDGGSALGRWRKRFVSKFALNVVMVFGLNLVNPLITLCKNIKLFNVPFLDYIILTMFIVAALNAIDSLNQTFLYMMLDKDGEVEYKNAKELAEKNIQGSLIDGITQTKNAVKLAGTVASLPVRGAVAAGVVTNRGYEAFKQHRFNARERGAINAGMTYNRGHQESLFNTMTNSQRREFGEDFLNTDAGRSFMNNMKGSTEVQRRTNALNAIEENKFQGRLGKGYSAQNARDSIFEHMHQRDLFEHSDMAKGLVAGTSEYQNALNEFSKMNKKQQRNSIMRSDSALNAQQENIRRARDNYRGSWVRQGANAVTGGVKKAGQAFGRVVSPVLNSKYAKDIKGTSQSLLQPFTELFKKPSK